MVGSGLLRDKHKYITSLQTGTKTKVTGDAYQSKTTKDNSGGKNGMKCNTKHKSKVLKSIHGT